MSNAETSYNPEMDKVLGVIELDSLNNKNCIEVKVFKYGNIGKPKIQLTRFYSKNGERKYLKLGRISLPEAEQLINAFQRILSKLYVKPQKPVQPQRDETPQMSF